MLPKSDWYSLGCCGGGCWWRLLVATATSTADAVAPISAPDAGDALTNTKEDLEKLGTPTSSQAKLGEMNG